jgi:phage tail-like protein
MEIIIDAEELLLDQVSQISAIIKESPMMPTNARQDPYRNFRYRVEIEGFQAAAFSDISGYDMSINSAQSREGSEGVSPRKLPRLRKHGNLTLKRGVVHSMDILNWIKKVSTGTVERKSIKITLVDETGQAAAVWQVVNAWPMKYSVSEFKGTGNEILIETLELAHEEMTRIK